METRTKVLIGSGIAVVLLTGIGVAKIVTSWPVETIKVIVSALRKYGITNVFAQAGINAVVSTEHGFVPQSENGYSKTSAARIRATFGKGRFPDSMTDAQIDALKASDEKFFNYVYANILGNNTTNGYKYRGRGFNGLTGYANYLRIGNRIGKDLVNNPDLMNTVPVAAEALAVFFADGWKGLIDSNSFKNVTEGTYNAFRLNAGWNVNFMANPTYAAEHKKQLKNAPEFLSIIQQAA